MDVPAPSSHRTATIAEYLDSLYDSPRFAPQIVAKKTFEKQQAVTCEFPSDMDKSLVAKIVDMGYPSLYSHQREAINNIRKNESVIVSTPTASGKSLIYNLCFFEQLLQDPRSHALYLYPLKALAQDQLRVITAMGGHLGDLLPNDSTSIAQIYDGDTSQYKRSRIRKETPPVLLYILA